ncbi:MAG: SMC-Scp complex subunit ScpB [Planctomycetaceae bacterium]|nr:SMC-Scp complex subunit ScpB [Planctomycetaceae bacterium]
MKKNREKSPFGAAIYTENTFSEPDEAEILSLDALRKAFAGLDTDGDETDYTEKYCTGTESPQPENTAEEPEYDEDFTAEETVQLSGKDNSDAEECTVKISPQSIVEAILFVGNADNKPFSAEQMAEKMRNVEPAEVDDYVEQLNEKYQRLACPYHIIWEKIGETIGYRMVLREEFDSIRAGFYGKTREVRLSQAAIDTLAAVAYRQPISADEVQKLRKQLSGALLSQLVNRGLLETETKIVNGKKTVLYRTTKRFLELFQLENLEDLPVLDDVVQ